MGLADHAKGLLRALLIRVVLVLVGCTALLIAMWINLDTGNEVLRGLISPASSLDIVVSVARLAAPAVGLGLIYRGLR